MRNTPDENNHAFLWDKQGGLKNLGELPGGLFSGAVWIKETGGGRRPGRMVGRFSTRRLEKRGGHRLGTVYGETCSQANSINSGGQIVGFASADCFNEDHAFLAQNGASWT